MWWQECSICKSLPSLIVAGEPGKRHALRAQVPEAATDWLNPLSLGDHVSLRLHWEFSLKFSSFNSYMSTQGEVFEGQTTARRAKRGGLWKGGPGVLPRKFSKTCIANGAIWIIPELYLSIQLAYMVIKCASKVSFKKHRPLCLTFCLCRCKCLWK